MPSEKEKTPPLHISIDGGDGHDAASRGSTTPKSATGWDGKLRVEKKLELVNPEALSDPEYSDDEKVVPGELIDADEGLYPSLRTSGSISKVRTIQLIQGSYRSPR